VKERVKGGGLGFVVTCSVIAIVVWGLIYLGLRPHASTFNTSVISTFIAFLFMPIIMLAISGRKLELGGCDKGFLVSVVVYQFFALWLTAYYWTNPDYFKDYEIIDGEYLLYLALVAFYVPSVDFFTRRIIHLEVERSWGEVKGLVVGTVAWMVGHSWELVWLSELTGSVGSFLFILISGVVTGLLYQRYKNVIGLMVGHWMLNLLVTMSTSLLTS
jgi:hypothetical protein